MAHSPRGWSGARTPSAIKRVRQSQRRRAINQPRRSAAKTLIARAIATTTNGATPEEIQEAVREAASALDLAAKAGAIHRNAAARRKSRLALKVNAALGGAQLVSGTKPARSTGKAAAAKQAKARIAASKASKSKGAQTAAGKARAALARSTREPAATAESTPAEAAASEKAAPKARGRAATATRKPAGGTGRTAGRAKAEAAAAEEKPKRTTRSTKKS